MIVKMKMIMIMITKITKMTIITHGLVSSYYAFDSSLPLFSQRLPLRGMTDKYNTIP